MLPKVCLSVALATLACAPAFGQADALTKVFEGQVRMLDQDVIPLAEAMPADKYDFAPTNGTFKGVRTFAQQVKHIATVVYMVSSASLNEKVPVDIGPVGSMADPLNGPDSLKTKEQIVAYLKGAAAQAHKAASAINLKNQMDQVKSPFGGGMSPRVDLVGMIAWHSFDHYGQMVVYGRMNNTPPPASQPPPPPAAGKKK